jgi:uncharacterized membrane protein
LKALIRESAVAIGCTKLELQTIQTTERASKSIPRFQFIDFTRGLVMMIMAWDHVSNFWMQIHGGLEGIYPYRNPALDLTMFLARFVTHWCAPTFVFLSGVSLSLSVRKRLSRGDSQRDVTLHIIKRGLLLLLFEAFLVSPAFDLPILYFGVIATIGIGLIIFSISRRLPTALILVASLILILNHQWLDLSFIPMDVAWGHYLRRILHEPGFTWRPYFALYPIIPWIGVMGLGWTFGTFLQGFDREKLPKLKLPLTATGFSSIVLFFLVRWVNGYGNLVRRWSGNIMDWLYVSKYPPSIAFLLWTLGGMCFFLAIGIFIEERNWSSKNALGAVNTFGMTPLFFYLTHLWLYRLRLPMVPPPFHLDLIQTLAFWVVGLVVLWMLCSQYIKIKRRYPRVLQYI